MHTQVKLFAEREGDLTGQDMNMNSNTTFKNFKFNWTVKDLYNGCLIASIAHAIMVAHYPMLSNEHSWDSSNYSIQDSCGIRGTITFYNGSCVGAFRDEKSTRIRTMHSFDPRAYLRNAPIDVQNMANNEALQYLLENVNGIATPVISCAFWGNEEGVFSNDSFDDFIKNGGSIIESHLLDFESTISALTEDYEMSNPQVTLLKMIYFRMIERPRKRVFLSKSEIDMIGCDDIEGLNESKASFEQIGVAFDIK